MVTQPETDKDQLVDALLRRRHADVDDERARADARADVEALLAQRTALRSALDRTGDPRRVDETSTTAPAGDRSHAATLELLAEATETLVDVCRQATWADPESDPVWHMFMRAYEDADALIPRLRAALEQGDVMSEHNDVPEDAVRAVGQALDAAWEAIRADTGRAPDAVVGGGDLSPDFDSSPLVRQALERLASDPQARATVHAALVGDDFVPHRDLEIAQSKYESAKRTAKGEQRAANRWKRWATQEVRAAHHRVGRLQAEATRLRVERDHAKQALDDVASCDDVDTARDTATRALEEITSGQAARDALPDQNL